MNNKIKNLILAAALASLTSFSFATDSSYQQRGSRMIQELNLTTDQQEQFKQVMQEQKSSAKAWRETHREQTKQKLTQFLTAEQMDKFTEMKKQRSEKRKMNKKNRKNQ